MTLLAAAGYYSDNARTEGEGKQTIEDLIQCAKETMGGAAESLLTIAAGTITPTAASHSVDTEAAAATDDLTALALTNHPAGRLVLLHIVSSARKVVVKHAAGGAGQIFLSRAVDLTLSFSDTVLALQRRGNDWHEVGVWFGASRSTSLNMSGAAINLAQGTAVANTTAALNLENTDGQIFALTSTVNITSVTLSNGRHRHAIAAGTFTLVPSAGLVISGFTSPFNRTVGAGDHLEFFAHGGVVYVFVTRASGKPEVGDFELTSAGVITNQATADITLPTWTLYDSALVHWRKLYPQTDNTSLRLRFAFDGGAFDTQAEYSSFAAAQNMLTGAADNNIRFSGETSGLLCESATGSRLSNNQVKASHGEMRIACLAADVGHKGVEYCHQYVNQNSTRVRHMNGRVAHEISDDFTLSALRFFMDSGNINMTYRVYGRRAA